MASARPKNLSADELEQYDLLLEEQATPFEEQAIKLHEANAHLAHDGVYDDGVKASYAALAKLMPARYGKTEAPPVFVSSLALSAVAPPPARLEAQLVQAVARANAGASGDAELEFRQLMEAAPQMGGAALDLGILLRAQGRLEDAAQALAEAVRREPGNAAALTALGLVQRERGEFAAAAESYGQALQADPGHAPAHRNLAVLRDMYMGDPAGSLDHFERYQALTGEERPVTSWIADVKQRAGKSREPIASPEAQAGAVP
jgi:tetratricopeptide (TPR) repeat protein